MPLDFTCPHCGARTIVEDQFLGHSGPCFSCSKTVTLPPPTVVARPAEDLSRPKRNRARLALQIAVALLGGAAAIGVMVSLLVLFLIPTLRNARNAAHESSCRTNLERIGLALRQYHDMHGSLPPAYFTDDKGRPTISWRVLILPQLGEEALYRQFDLSQPWDSPINTQAARRMPAVYACSADEAAQAQKETSYVAVVGPKTAFPDEKSRSWADFRDGVSGTLLIVESHDSGIPWSKPQDLSAASLRRGINVKGPAGTVCRSRHTDGAMVLLADGQALLLPEDATSDGLEALSTVQGGEQIPWEVLLDAK